ncbi:MAG: CDP-diacylglycerol--glycerol-3-phosphate 3-phosphatidyltransferase [Phycisphaerales bacterium]|nr:CDP-diacylglycerol--glycerol-3-phosphate 3-phosphatidyltransferase [Phycisphaerales bacterium]
MKLNLPNQITLARLVLAIVFFAFLAQFDIRTPHPWVLDVCIVIFIVAAATDWLDGYLARKHNQVTAMGRVLDPFVDKVLVCGAFVFLAGSSFHEESGQQATRMYPWMVVVILGRELLVTGLRGFSEARGISFGAVNFGKAKMVLQSITAPVLMFFVAHIDPTANGPSFAWIKTALAWLTVAVTTLSMLPYLMQSRHVLSEADAA